MPTAKPHNSNGVIRVRGAREHNLRGVDLDLPRGQLTVFCGASGSGKTSMAIDTLYAEGQRRYIESFSPYTRQFLQRLEKPDVEHIDGLPPAIAITQRAASRSNRATVATATEIADHLRVLFARLGEVVCPECLERVQRDSADSIAERVATYPADRRLMIAFPYSPPEQGESWSDWAAPLIEAGFVRAVIGQQTVTLTDDLSRFPLPPSAVVIVDRLKTGDTDESRVAESIETALVAGDDACVLIVEQQAGDETIDARQWSLERFSTRLRCDACDRDFTPPEPRLFDFNNPLGACPQCEGFGSVNETDMNRIVPDRSKSLREGAIAPWNTPAYAHELEELLALAPDYGIPVDAPFRELTDEHLGHILHGVAERDFGGIDGFIAWLERRKYKMHLRVFLSRWRSYRNCPSCDGARLGADAMAVQLASRTFAQVLAMNVKQAMEFIEGGSKQEQDAAAAPQQCLPPTALPLAEPMLARLEYLQLVGLGYLTLDRSLRTLSAGEARRVAMTSLLGSNLVDLLYVLDEPSVGLHPADVDALADALGRLRDRGATVVVVEHEESILRSADHIVEFGPAAGAEGGDIVFRGTPTELLNAENSRTGDWLAGRRIMPSGNDRTPTDEPLQLRGASGANLTAIDVDFPVGLLTVVTGVSGAGKTSLVLKTLVPALEEALAQSGKGNGESGNGKAESGPDAAEENSELDVPCFPFASLHNAAAFDGVQLIDRTPVARSPRSNPVTYVKALDAIRALFASSADAKARGFTAKHFSFNVDGGRCEACSGAGHTVVDMQFLADIAVPCSECHGRRYRAEVLDIKHRGRDIAEVLQMTALDAFRFFRGEQKVQARLRPLIDVGLGYLPLGQPTSTLSGGESQRLKLAGALAARSSKTSTSGRTLFVLDEPTTGLHFSDIPPLLDCFDALLDIGHTVIVIEHNVQLMMAANWIIDLGPGAAADGGRVVATGTPAEVAKQTVSATGRALGAAFRREAAALAEIEEVD